MSGELRISTHQDELDLELIHDFLSTHSSWAKGISMERVRKSIAHSLCFGGYVGSKQVAFGRVISDFATFANLVDVFVTPDQRGHGYGKQLVDAVMAHPDLQGLRRFTLATFDAHTLYERYGFRSPQRPETLMEIYVPDIYLNAAQS
ncbi:GNAT family N-acetyltransferase [Dyella sp. 20L07]|uniref:GNAT family N-acetyltransferase n=1 Tax=Dyella sp. 20L07 TaxID=3384240 RepID=UPI003D2D6A40